MKKGLFRVASLLMTIVIGVSTKGIKVEAADNFQHLSNLESMINVYRTDNGLTPLEVQYNYKAGTDIRAKELASSFSHTRPDGSEWYTADSTSFYGENLARKQDSIADDKILLAWQLSKEHNRNLLEPRFRTMYVSMYYSSADNTYYVACEFGV